MNQQYIKSIITEELKSVKNIADVGSHGVDLKICLIEPTLESYLSPNDEIKTELWTVLEEAPNRDGYIIYFDEKTESFGLGIKSGNELIDIGRHGTFLDTLVAM